MGSGDWWGDACLIWYHIASACKYWSKSVLSDVVSYDIGLNPNIKDPISYDIESDPIDWISCQDIRSIRSAWYPIGLYPISSGIVSHWSDLTALVSDQYHNMILGYLLDLIDQTT